MLKIKIMNVLIGVMIVLLTGIAILMFSLSVMHGSYILAGILVGISVGIGVLVQSVPLSYSKIAG